MMMRMLEDAALRKTAAAVALIGSLAIASLSAQEGAPARAGSAAAPAGNTAPAGNPPAGNIATGKTLYIGKACYQCHGYEGQGAASLGGPRIGPNPIPYRRFIAYLRTPATEMPPYSTKVLSEQDVADIYAYLQARTVPPPVRDIPLLAQ
jgi:ubiquinol-cytochrome c reductase cytochrome c subunit